MPEGFIPEVDTFSLDVFIADMDMLWGEGLISSPDTLSYNGINWRF